MQINTARDLAEWVLKAPRGAVNASIMDVSTGGVPQSLGAYVRQLDDAGYICAFWRKEEPVENGYYMWAWYLHRTKKAVTRQRLQDLMSQALIELKERHNATD